jgi:hypothetical protein
MSSVSETLQIEKNRADESRSVAGAVNIVKSREDQEFLVHRPFPMRRGGSDPLGDARNRVRAQRRAEHGFQF